MPISVQCPGCGKKLKAGDELAAKRAKCPGCGQPLVVPPLPSASPRANTTAPAPRKSAPERSRQPILSPTPAGRPARWLCYAGGGAAVCLVAGAVFLVAMSGKDRTGDSGAQEAPGSGGLTREKLLGEWEGTLKDGTAVALKFTDQFVVVSVLAPGTNREKAREAAEWVSGSPGRALGGGGFGIGSTAYEIDAEKNEVGFGFPEPTAKAKPTNDGALLVSGEFKTANFTCTVPETRIERVKPDAPAKGPPAQLPGGKATLKQEPPTTPKREAPLPGAKGERVEYVGKPTNPWAVYLSEDTDLPKGGPKAPWKQVFPSGTRLLVIGVVFTGEPNYHDVSVKLLSDAGEVEMADQSKPDWILINSTYVRKAHLQPKSGSFRDGAYQAEVYYKGSKVAVLNWTVGKPPEQGTGAKGSAKSATDPLPSSKRNVPELAPFAGEWTGFGHHLHLDADGFGFGLVRLLHVHTEELRIRKGDGKWVMDFPDEVTIGPARREFRTKPMTVRLGQAGTLDLYDSSGKLWYALKKRTEPRPQPAAADFAGEWKVWSVSADGMGFKEGREWILKLKNLKLSLSPDGTGTARFVAEEKAQVPPAKLTFQQAGDRFILGGLEGKEWEMKFFYIAEKERLIRLRTRDRAIRIFTYARKAN